MHHQRLLYSTFALGPIVRASIWRSSSKTCFSSSPCCCQKGLQLLPDAPVRTRFAPSPTGYLHLGSLRTALFSYLLAKKTGGQFLLRIEDTDERRTVPGAEKRLCEDLQWAGIQWDEGPLVGGPYGPYKQSERTPLYKEHADILLESRHAYRCFCSVERLDDLARRRQALGLPTDYDRTCAGIPKEESDDRAHQGEAHVVRLKAPEKYPEFRDLVYGKVGKDKGDNLGITMKHGEIAYEDPVLLKTDGRPTYHLANVVDDHHMKITHVVRATEWISSTPKHLALYNAFGWSPPAFAHVGLLVDEAGRKLSKRNFDTDIANFKNMGVLPEALTNFVALLGWSHDQKSDVMSIEQLIENFRMKFTKGNTIVTLDKLWYLQRNHAARAAQIQDSSFGEMTDRLVARVQTVVPDGELKPILAGRSLKQYLSAVLRSDARNYTTPESFIDRNIYFFTAPEWQPYESSKPSRDLQTVQTAARDLMTTEADQWSAEHLDQRMKAIVNEAAPASLSSVADSKAAIKEWNKEFYHYLRWVLFNGKQGPQLANAMAMLGPEICTARLEGSRSIRSKHE